MFDKFFIDPQWAQVAIAGLVAAFTLGTLIAVAISARIQWRDRRDRDSLNLPEVEVDVSPLADRPNAFRVQLTVRNFGITSIELRRLDLLSPRGALLLDPQAAQVRKAGIIDIHAPIEVHWDKAARSIALHRSLSPVGPTGLWPQPANLGSFPKDSASLEVWLLLVSAKPRSANMRLHSRRKTRADRETSVPVFINIPAAANSKKD